MDLFTLLIIGWILKKIFGNKKKAEQKKQAQRKAMDEAFSANAYRTATPRPAQTMLPPLSGLHDLPAAPKATVAPAMTVAQPLVHTHLAPDCDEHDRSGSLGVTTQEGKDACHEDQLAPVNAPRPTISFPKEEPGLQLDWSGENMVKAFVMQEVLTRPCDRRRRA